MAMLNKKQAAEYLGITEHAFARLVAKGLMAKGVGAGRRFFFGESVLDKWKSENKEFIDAMVADRWTPVIEKRDGYINGPVVQHLLGTNSNQLIYAKIKRGEFPKEKRRAGTNVFWDTKEVIEFFKKERESIQEKIEYLESLLPEKK